VEAEAAPVGAFADSLLSPLADTEALPRPIPPPPSPLRSLPPTPSSPSASPPGCASVPSLSVLSRRPLYQSPQPGDPVTN